VVFVEPGKYPKDDSKRLDVLRRMNAHADTCDSGDNTLEATKRAIEEITKEPGDEVGLGVFSFVCYIYSVLILVYLSLIAANRFWHSI
jgi:hypothetical protein